MTVYKRKDSQYWYYDFKIDGRQYQGSTRTTNKNKAQQVAALKRTETHASIMLGELRPITLVDAINNYLKAHKAKDTNTKSCCHRLQGFILDQRTKGKKKVYGLNPIKPIHELKTKDITRLHDERVNAGYVDGTINHELQHLKRIIEKARVSGFRIPKLEYPKIKIKRNRLRFLDSDEEQSLLEECKNGWNKDLYDFVLMLFDTGCRYQEVSKLPWSKVDFDKREITVWREKVQRYDAIPMTKRVRKVLKQRRKNRTNSDGIKDRYVFMNRTRTDHKKYSRDGIAKAMERAGINTEQMIKEKGCKATAHTLRHTFASKLIQKGMSLYEVGMLLGHADSKSTEVYSHLVPSDVGSKAVAILDGK